MFDLARIAEAVGSLAGGNNAENGLAGIMQQLAELGIDPAELQGLAPQQIVDFLSKHGIDVGNLEVGQLTELAGQLGASDLVATAGQWLSDRLLRS